MLQRNLVAALIVAVCAGLACGDTNPSSQPTTSTASPGPGRPAAGRLAFVSDRAGDFEIFSMNADGSGLWNLSDNLDADFGPSWSRDGTRIAFYRVIDGVWELRLMHADASNVSTLTEVVPGPDTFPPAWSPSGDRLAFESSHEGNAEVYVIATDGSGLLNLSSNPARDYGPAWSPDGERIAFSSERGDVSDIYTTGLDGSDPQNVTDDPIVDRSPAWSAENDRLVFRSELDNGRSTIRTVNGDGGGGATDLGGGHEIDFFNSNPVWSPDGTLIAFRAGSDVHVLTSDGSSLTNVTNDAAGYYHPIWSPDGKHVAVASFPEGGGAIYAIEANSASRTDITQQPAGYFTPSWTSE